MSILKKINNKNNNQIQVSLKFGDPKKPDLHVCIESFGKRQYCVIPYSVKIKFASKLISENTYIKKFGKIFQIALNSLLNQKKNSNSDNTICKPALILCPFERTGSTWITDPIDYFARGHTEPFRQHIELKNPICPVDAYCENIDHDIYCQKLKIKKYFQFWLSNLYSCFFSVQKVQIIKETNLFFTLKFILKLLPADTPIVFLVRDIRGILSSFRKRNLYYEWNYKDRFKKIKKLVLENKKLKNKYSTIILETDENSWIDCLIGLYIISASEIQEHLLFQYPTKQIMLVRYEDLIEDKKNKIFNVYRHLNIPENILPNIKKIIKQQSILNNGVGKFNIYKTKNPVDWLKNFSINEHHYIVLRVKKRLDQLKLSHPNGKNICQGIKKIGLDVDYVNNTSTLIYKNNKKINKKRDMSLMVYSLSRNKIRKNIENNLVKISSIKNNFSFCVSNTYITNETFVSFLNYLKKIGITNTLIDGHYLFYNSNIISSRGGRIFINKNKQFAVLSGFEKHPVNWISWLGASLFSVWVGMRLLDEIEWELIANQSTPIEKNLHPELIANIRHSIGDTTSVYKYKANNLGIYDMFGNVRTWCINWYSYKNKKQNYLTFMKAVKGGSWNRDITNIHFKDYKPWLMSARGIGFRLLKDDKCNLLNNNNFNQLTKNVIEIISQKYNSFEDLCSITKKINDIICNNLKNLKICIGGEIGTGKTTLSKKLNFIFQYEVVSFSKIIINQLLKRGKNVDRKSVQKFGLILNNKYGYSGKLDWIINHSNKVDWTKPMIIDGLRNREVYQQCKKKFNTTLICCSCSKEE